MEYAQEQGAKNYNRLRFIKDVIHVCTSTKYSSVDFMSSGLVNLVKTQIGYFSIILVCTP